LAKPDFTTAFEYPNIFWRTFCSLNTAVNSSMGDGYKGILPPPMVSK